MKNKIKWKLEQKLQKLFNLYNVNSIWVKINDIIEDLIKPSIF